MQSELLRLQTYTPVGGGKAVPLPHCGRLPWLGEGAHQRQLQAARSAQGEARSCPLLLLRGRVTDWQLGDRNMPKRE